MTERWPTRDEAVADSVRQRIHEFVTEFDDRTTDRGALERICSGETFRGGIVQQKPEFFTEQYLIIPLLDALGYAAVRRRPVQLVKDEINQPDLQIDDPPATIECIVEAKRLNREREEGAASRQVEGYLMDDTFVKYATERDRRHLSGIATDGLVWALYAKPIGTSDPKLVDHADVTETLRTINSAARGLSAETERLNIDLRTDLVETLVRSFAKHNLHEAISEAFPDR